MAANDPNTLIDGAKCLECQVPIGFLWPIIINLLARNAGVSNDPNTLIDGAKCIEQCVPRGMYLPIMINLLAVGGGGGGGGSGSVFSGHYAGGAPTQTPTTSAAIAYDLDLPSALWRWNGSAWF